MLRNVLGKSEKFVGLVGEFVSLENLTAFKDFMNRLDCDDFGCMSYPI